MAYDDVIGVADLKSRAERFARVRGELGAPAGEVIGTEEFFHPRLEEVCATLPARLGLYIETSPRLRAWLARRVERGRRIRSQTLSGYLQLRAVAAMRHWRRKTLRHQRERCRRLVKGYSDTHARGSSRFHRLLAAAALLAGRPDAAACLGALLEAALRDASGARLETEWQALGLPAGERLAGGQPPI